MTERLLLLDGHSLAYRAFYALPTTITTSSGQVTNAVYGFTSMLIKLLSEQGTERVCVAFDVGAPTARLGEYAEYKAHRPEAPSEFRPQVGLIREVLQALRVPVFGVEEHEADDVIATLARRAAEQGLEAVIVTADRDFLQMVRPGILVLFNRRGVTDYTLYDRAGVEERFGLPPERLVDLAALRGDPSDNLPGVPGVGEKTAADLVRRFGTVEALFARLGELGGRHARLRPALEAAREQVLRNKRLSTLLDDLPVEADPREIRMGEWDLDEVRRLFGALEFRSLLERLASVRSAPGPGVASEVSVRGAGSIDSVAMAGGVGLAWPQERDGIAIASEDGEAVWVPERASVAGVLADPAARKVAHDAKDLMVRLGREGAQLGGLAFDTQVAAYLLDPAPGRYDLAALSVRHLGRGLPGARPVAEGQLALEMGEDEAAACRARAAVLPALADRLGSELERLGMRCLFEDVEMPLVGVLARMELVGVGIDVDRLASQSKEVGSRLSALEEEIHRHAGGPFNPNSPPQLREVLYTRLGLKPTRRTKTGYSTDAQALASLAGQHPIVEALLRYRELEKLRSTYLDALPRLVDPRTGRLHATFKQTAVATGRISTENPNLQNVPVRTDLGRDVRRAFVAGFPEHVLLVADYSQIELRVLAHITGDQGLRAAFARDEDVHAATAARVWHLPPGEVPREMRGRAKAINFGLAYGMNAFGLAQRLGISAGEAQEFVDSYFEGFPGVKEFMGSVVRDAYRDGYTVTLLGRRRYLPELGHASPRIRSLGERQALNAPIQGSAADIIKLAMIRVDRGLPERGLGARMVLTVHDELLFEVPEAEVDATREAVRSLMEQAYPLDVPLKVDIAVGRSWAEAKP
ncbi:MAG: DNA polymerase I [Acidobacteria bacterium]|nr:DNA polymerase I [Acidobacteriota bacterium]